MEKARRMFQVMLISMPAFRANPRGNSLIAPGLAKFPTIGKRRFGERTTACIARGEIVSFLMFVLVFGFSGRRYKDIRRRY
jgi:hypothetical protein